MTAFFVSIRIDKLESTCFSLPSPPPSLESIFVVLVNEDLTAKEQPRDQEGGKDKDEQRYQLPVSKWFDCVIVIAMRDLLWEPFLGHNVQNSILSHF